LFQQANILWQETQLYKQTLALEIFKPFVIKRILDKEMAFNIRGAARLVEEKTPEVWAILEEIIKDKLVLLNLSIFFIGGNYGSRRFNRIRYDRWKVSFSIY
jgi:hypothetical protein